MIRTLLILTTVGLLVGHPSTAQVLVQDAKNSSSVLYRGNAINFNLTEGQISFALNSYGNERKEDIKTTQGKANWLNFWGVQGSAKSRNGLAGIVNAGSLVPEGSFNLTGGHTWTSSENNPGYKEAREALQSLYTIRGEQIRTAADLLDNIQESIIAKAKSSTIIDNALQGEIDQAFIAGTDDIADNVKKLADKQADSTKKAELLSIELNVRERLALFQQLQTLTEKQVKKYRDQVERSYWKERHLIYGVFGGSASSFSYLTNPTATTNLSERFDKKTFESVRYGFGYNYQRAGRTVIGFSITGQNADNFNELTEKDYTLLTATQTNATTSTTQPVASTVVTQRLEEKQAFKGYEGNYQAYHQTSINADLVKFYQGFNSDDGVIALNYYARWQLSSKPAVVPSMLNVGAGAYFFKNNGTFLGGLYLEFPDVTNQAEKLKSDPVFKPFYNRISFGIVTKFSISSIISYKL